ncbi:MAG TPA: translation elongation factor 4 [Armatimonadota bacterium]|nr:translation elongation factor 4 [Armatimonadota bacterium]
MIKQSRIRNFCIIAHIDHGKSTLADRLLEYTGVMNERIKTEQILDSMDLERERGITIKASAVAMTYRAKDGKDYELNLIDTPGHVDFHYEVSRSLAACEGAILVVDAVQGVEAQTVANCILANEQGLTLIPVINKIDLPSADPERVRGEIEDALAIPGEDAILASAKEGIGTEDILEAIISQIPAPQGENDEPLQAMIFDSHFDPYRGIIAYVRVRHGIIRPEMRIQMMSTGKSFEVQEVGRFTLGMNPTEQLVAGEVGYVAAGIKSLGDARVGDTITDAARPAVKQLPGFHEAKPMVFCGLYPTDSSDYPVLREALEKLQLNDAAIVYEPETSSALGFGFRTGFLGLLHMEIVQERLEREYNLSIIATSPSVVYRVTTTKGEVVYVDNPADMPPTDRIHLIEEPYVVAKIIAPSDYIGPCMELAQERRGIYQSMEYAGAKRVIINYELPLGEILLDFFDQLKSRTRGYASFDYEFSGYREGDLVKVNMMVNGDQVDALSFITPRERAYRRGAAMAKRLKEVIPRQQLEIRIQAAIGTKIIAAESVRPYRKDVIAKCYGGDITRKRKLLEKQKAGKKRMKSIGSVDVPQEAFMSVLQLEE